MRAHVSVRVLVPLAHTLAQEAKRFEEALDELDRQLSTQEGELARNPLKQRYGVDADTHTYTYTHTHIQRETKKCNCMGA